MQFHLVHFRRMLSGLGDFLQFGYVEIGNPNMPCQALFFAYLHSSPSLRKRNVLVGKKLFPGLRKTHSMLEADRPMDEVQIQLIKSKILQRGFDSGNHVIEAVVAVPELGSDEQFFPFHQGVLNPVAS